MRFVFVCIAFCNWAESRCGQRAVRLSKARPRAKHTNKTLSSTKHAYVFYRYRIFRSIALRWLQSWLVTSFRPDIGLNNYLINEAALEKMSMFISTSQLTRISDQHFFQSTGISAKQILPRRELKLRILPLLIFSRIYLKNWLKVRDTPIFSR